MYHICFTNPDAWEIGRPAGVYGNVDTGNNSRQTFLGKLGDLVALAPGDRVFFYIKETKSLSGVFEVVGEPYFCQDDLFQNPAELYSLRFNFAEVRHFDVNIPISELAKLIENRQIYSLTSFERDQNAGFRGIRQITNAEGLFLEETFLRFNPKVNSLNVGFVEHLDAPDGAELKEIVEETLIGTVYSEPTQIYFSSIPVERIRVGTYASKYENILQAYIFYCLRRNLNNVVEQLDLTNFTECLMEFPLLRAEQYRPDILCLFRDGLKAPHFYSILEIKRKLRIPIERLSQLIGYMKTFAAANEIPFNSMEGVYISLDFEHETIEYLKNRRDVEKKNPVRLVKYFVDANGVIGFEAVNLD